MTGGSADTSLGYLSSSGPGHELHSAINPYMRPSSSNAASSVSRPRGQLLSSLPTSQITERSSSQSYPRKSRSRSPVRRSRSPLRRARSPSYEIKKRPRREEPKQRRDKSRQFYS